MYTKPQLPRGLTEWDVAAIVKAARLGYSQRFLAGLYRVSPAQIWLVVVHYTQEKQHDGIRKASPDGEGSGPVG